MELKNNNLKKKEVYLIGCHIENFKQLALLSELVDKLTNEGKDYVLSSHTMIPESIVKKSVGFVYDSVNPKYKTWDLEGITKYIIDVGPFSITSPYITYGRKDYYHVGVLRLLINGINYIKNLDYDVVHWIEYDILPDFEEDLKNLDRLNTYDFVFYGYSWCDGPSKGTITEIGGKFSFSIDRVNKEFLYKSDKELLRILSNNSYVAEKVTKELLVSGNKIYITVEDPSFFGRYSHNDEMKLDWSLFEENDNVIIFFNNYETKKEIKISLHDKDINLCLEPGFWNLYTLSHKDEFKKIHILVDGTPILELENIDHILYQKLVSSVQKTDKK